MKLLLTLLIFAVSTSVYGQHFVLVPGLGHEQIPDYFRSLEAHLRRHGFRKISRLNPSSLRTISENQRFVKSELLRLHRLHGEAIVIIAHSKGSLEVANTLATENRSFPEAIVSHAISANTPFQGSPYMAESIREFEATYGRFGNQYNPVYLNALAVLNSLSTESIRADLERSFRNLSAAEKRSLSVRTFYLRTVQDAEKVSSALKKSAAFLKNAGENDGLIPAKNQRLPDFGNDLGLFRGIDHGDLFVRQWGPDSAEARAIDKALNTLGLLN